MRGHFLFDSMSIEVSENIKKLLSLPKQIRFAAATALTAVAKEGQEAAIEAIEENFETRNPWYLPSSAHGVHISPATVSNLTSEVKSSAWWLVPHETGEDKTPQSGQFLKVPVDPRRRVRNASRTFVMRTRRGPVIFQRNGRGITPLYGLERRVRIRKRSTIIEPTVRVVEERFGEIFSEKLAKAIETAR